MSGSTVEESGRCILFHENDNQHVSLRPRGSSSSCHPRSSRDCPSTAFSRCTKCSVPLSDLLGLSSSTRPSSSTWLLSCGHVLCSKCVSDSRCTTGEMGKRGCKCHICHIFVRPHLLPSEENVNLDVCRDCECRPARASCSSCGDRRRCPGCHNAHLVHNPQHVGDPYQDVLSERSRNEAFLACIVHDMPVQQRCTCGELLCADCLSGHVSAHAALDEDHRESFPLSVEDNEIDDFISDPATLQEQIRTMAEAAKLKKEKFDESVDNFNNEIANHFNLMILQCIQRCWDLMKSVKDTAEIQHRRLESNMGRLKRLEMMVVAGVEVDEWGRDRRFVREDSISELLRSISYGICGNAMKELRQLEEIELIVTKPDIRLPYDTETVMNDIRQWGSRLSSNCSTGNTFNFVPTETRPTKMVNILGQTLHSFYPKGTMGTYTVPHRVHTALDHFETLYQHRFHSLVPVNERVKVFSVGKVPSEDIIRARTEPGASLQYEKAIHSTEGLLFMPPRAINGTRILNLRSVPGDSVEMKQRQINIPVQAPLWFPDGSLDSVHMMAHRMDERKRVLAEGRIPEKSPPPLLPASSSPSPRVSILPPALVPSRPRGFIRVPVHSRTLVPPSTSTATRLIRRVVAPVPVVVKKVKEEVDDHFKEENPEPSSSATVTVLEGGPVKMEVKEEAEEEEMEVIEVPIPPRPSLPRGPVGAMRRKATLLKRPLTAEADQVESDPSREAGYRMAHPDLDYFGPQMVKLQEEMIDALRQSSCNTALQPEEVVMFVRHFKSKILFHKDSSAWHANQFLIQELGDIDHAWIADEKHNTRRRFLQYFDRMINTIGCPVCNMLAHYTDKSNVYCKQCHMIFTDLQLKKRDAERSRRSTELAIAAEISQQRKLAIVRKMT